MDEIAYAWAPITKSEEQDDGTFMVYGPAASSHLDRDRQRLNEQWLDQAMPAWFEQGANIREQHDAKRAVGVGVGLVKGDGDSGHMLASHVVDPVACLKVKHGVLKGYSVGIKSPKVKLGKADAPGGEVVGGDIVEVSLVDRPCNPTTLFEIAKTDGAGGQLAAVADADVVEKSDAAAFGIPELVYGQLPDAVRGALTALAAAGTTVTTETVKTEMPAAEEGTVVSSPTFMIKLHGAAVDEGFTRGVDDAGTQSADVAKADLSAPGRRRAARAGTAMADGSYPIASKSDLRKAIRAVGRGSGDHDAIHRHIIKRAKALGLESMVPTDWTSGGTKNTAATTASKVDETTTEDTAAVQEADAEKAEAILRDVRALVPALTKADDGGEDTGDRGDGGDGGGEITSADQAVAVIAQLIVGEAEALADGNFTKAITIGLLLDAVRSLRWFKRELECAEDMVRTDTTKADEATPAEPAKQEAPAATADSAGTENTVGPLTKADVAELLTSAVAEATAAQEERITALTGDLTKATQAIEELRAQPAAGGPVLTRTPGQAAAARTSDADRLRAEARTLQEKADAVGDRDLREGYLERSRELLAKADA
jgi:hypothetical protein